MTDSDFLKALNSTNTLRITFTGRKTGKKFSTDVWFVADGDKVYLLPTNGTATNWYRNVVKNPAMELQASGKKAAAKASPIKDKEQVDEVFERFTAKYGGVDMKNYYPRHDAAVELIVSPSLLG
jgi:deazaflavin-dependent oxidoreductase (nitroreductase family)